MVMGGDGEDTVHGGRVLGMSQVEFFGADGFDQIDYSGADRFVTIAQDDVANDGRPGDQDNVRGEVEQLVGSVFPDRLTGSPGQNFLIRGLGADVLRGLGGNDRISQEGRSDGADDSFGGPGRGAVSYARRTAGVRIDLDAVADDGLAGEGDNVRRDIEVLTGGRRYGQP